MGAADCWSKPLDLESAGLHQPSAASSSGRRFTAGTAALVHVFETAPAVRRSRTLHAASR